MRPIGNGNGNGNEHGMAIRITSTATARAYLEGEGVEVEALALTEDGAGVVESASCERCGGSGYGPWHPDGGRCYDCHGQLTSGRTRTVSLKVWARRVKARNTAQVRASKAAAKRGIAKLESQRTWCRNHGLGDVTFAELDMKRAAEREAAKGKSRHVGTVKKRETFEVEFVACPGWEGMYGYQYLHIFRDMDGNALVWRTGEPWFRLPTEEDDYVYHKLQKGDKITLKGTVKGHDEHEGEKQTVLTRCVRVA